MIISLICEMRSGSTNLANWFYSKKDFTLLFEPITNPNLRWYKGNNPPKNWEYITNHMVIKEVFHIGCNFSELIEISDKVIVLYRKNELTQMESWVNANRTKNWGGRWVHTNKFINPRDTEIEHFHEMKKAFNELYVKDNKYFTTTYEELYYENGFQRLVDYLNIDGVKNENFPHGNKYRIDVDGKQTLI